MRNDIFMSYDVKINANPPVAQSARVSKRPFSTPVYLDIDRESRELTVLISFESSRTQVKPN